VCVGVCLCVCGCNTYVCVYVGLCMYVCVYVRMHVCLLFVTLRLLFLAVLKSGVPLNSLIQEALYVFSMNE